MAGEPPVRSAKVQAALAFSALYGFFAFVFAILYLVAKGGFNGIVEDAKLLVGGLLGAISQAVIQQMTQSNGWWFQSSKGSEDKSDTIAAQALSVPMSTKVTAVPASAGEPAKIITETSPVALAPAVGSSPAAPIPVQVVPAADPLPVVVEPGKSKP